ncbi:MAG: diaminobutyrate acetyltransferase, partial [Pseudomonadota bacterium]|nr:diaminobutyrate acetyltransferase [Pseudomonadota bacterium]
MPKDMMPQKQTTAKVTLRKPVPTDGAAIWELVRACRPLDENSMYANLIQADHFRDTCVLAELDGEVVGWISGHLIPKQDAFFVWQVAVGPKARGMGLGKRMLLELLSRDDVSGAAVLKTTITKDNDASWALFRSFVARRPRAMAAASRWLRTGSVGRACCRFSTPSALSLS